MPRRVLEGEVVSDKMDKTVTVLVTRRFMHPMYKKFVRKSAKYAAHDENNSFKVGDRVQIEECRPISKRKTWTVITVPGPDAGRPKRETAKATAEREAKADAAEKKAQRKAVKDEKKAKAESAAEGKTEAKTAKKAPAKKAPAKKKATSKKKDD